MDLGPIPGPHWIAMGLDLRLGHLKQLIECAQRQGGKSRGQHDWVHGFPEPVE